MSVYKELILNLKLLNMKNISNYNKQDIKLLAKTSLILILITS